MSGENQKLIYCCTVKIVISLNCCSEGNWDSDSQLRISAGSREENSRLDGSSEAFSRFLQCQL